MVRRKDDSAPEREIKPVRKAVEVKEEPEPRPTTAGKKFPVRKRGGAFRAILGIVLVIVLVGGGWFATRAMLNAGSGGGFLAGLFQSSELMGESEGRVNVLLVGQPGDPGHDGPELTDTVILASYNTKDKYLHMFSIPRDMYVSVPGMGGTRINAVLENAESSGEDGPKALATTVEDLLGLKVPYYITIDFAGFKQVVDQLGGVTLSVEKDLYDPFYPAPSDSSYQLVDIKAGTYTMDGETALKYVRSRKTTSDFDRARRQQQVLLALREKAKDLELLTAPTKIFEISEVVKDHFATNLTADEMKRALELLADFDASRVTNKVFDDSAAGLLYGTRVEGAYVLKPVDDDYSKLKDFVTNALAQVSGDGATEEEADEVPLKIEVLNGTNVTGLAGKIAEELEKAGFEVVKVGNSPTKGIKESILYDGTAGKRFSALRRLAELGNATVSGDTVSLGEGIEARLVLGENAVPAQ